MKRALLVAALLLTGCRGPIPLNMAIYPQHEREYSAAMAADPSSPRDAWYAYLAKKEGKSVDAIRMADQALSTTHNPFNARTDHDAVSRGAVIFENQCARCHGADAQGNGPDMLPGHPTRNFHSFGNRFAATIHGGAPRTWFRKIENGSGDMLAYPAGRSHAMPAFGDKLAREQIWSVITYLQSLDMYARPAEESTPSTG
jgi:mono/diheme cytochrome c family protein